MAYELSPSGLDFLETQEGCVLHSYRDSVGLWTIGIGNRFNPDGTPVHPGEVITRAQAEEYIEKDLVYRLQFLNRVLPGNLSTDQVDALVSLCYNIGTTGFGNSSLLRSLKNDPTKANDENIIHNWKKWDEAGGKFDLDLLKRRERELTLYFSSQLPLSLIQKY